MKSLANVKPEDVPDSLKSAVASWLKLEAMVQLKKEEVQAVEYELLTGPFAFFNDRRAERGEAKERITDSDRLYLSRDDDLAKEYYLAKHDLLMERGIKNASLIHFCDNALAPDYCPYLILKSAQTECEWVILDLMNEFLEMGLKEGELNHRLLCGTKREGKWVDGLTFRREFIDTTIKLVVSLPDFEVELP